MSARNLATHLLQHDDVRLALTNIICDLHHRIKPASQARQYARDAVSGFAHSYLVSLAVIDEIIEQIIGDIESE